MMTCTLQVHVTNITNNTFHVKGLPVLNMIKIHIHAKIPLSVTTALSASSSLRVISYMRLQLDRLLHLF